MPANRNLNRVDHIAWIVYPENQDRYVELFSNLFDTQFDGPLRREDTGNCLWVSWEAGLEILSPYGDSPAATMWQRRLEERGEGFLAVIFGVGDIEATKRRLNDAGHATTGVIGAIGGEPWAHKLETFKEIIVERETLGTVIAFGQIDYADGVIGS